MAKHVIFLIHGMGVYVDKEAKPQSAWFDEAVKSLKKNYNKYERTKKLFPFDQAFKVVNLEYDTLFHKIVSNWADESSKVGAAIGARSSLVKSLTGWLKGADDTDDFVWSHLVDAALYRFFPTVRQAVKAHIALQIYDALGVQEDGSVKDWSVIAHSQGTIVVHDALHAMDIKTTSQSGVPLLDAASGRARCVAMIANVSKLLETDVNVYKETHVIPPSPGNTDSVCHHYLNINNKYDPFTLVRPFNPRGLSDWEQARAAHTYDEICVSHIQAANTHGFSHYLDNPQVHIPLFRAMLADAVVTKAEERDAKKAYKLVKSDSLKKKVAQKLDKELKDKIPTLGGSDFDFETAFKAIVKVLT